MEAISREGETIRLCTELPFDGQILVDIREIPENGIERRVIL